MGSRTAAPLRRSAAGRSAAALPAAVLGLSALVGLAPAAAAAETGPETADAAAHSASTTSGGDDNIAVAVNTRDGSTVYAVRLKVVMTAADVVDSGNAAVAAASCSDCQTVAIALEGVLATGSPSSVTVTNLALALNEECSSCRTLAYAYQHLQTTDGRVRITGAGRHGIALLRQQLNALRTSGLDIDAVKAEVDRIVREFARILETEVLPLQPV